MSDRTDKLQEQNQEIIAGRTVLVVDDEADIRGTIKKLLTRMLPGLKIVTANTGQEGLKALGKGSVDVVLCDYRMPDMDGLEMLTQASKSHPDVPRVMITAYPDRELQQRASTEAQVDGFFTKPPDPTTVIQVVEDMLRIRWMNDMNP